MTFSISLETIPFDRGHHDWAHRLGSAKSRTSVTWALVQMVPPELSDMAVLSASCRDQCQSHPMPHPGSSPPRNLEQGCCLAETLMLSPNIAPQTITEVLKQDERSPSSAPFSCDETTQPSGKVITHLINHLTVLGMRHYLGCVGGRMFRCFFVIC